MKRTALARRVPLARSGRLPYRSKRTARRYRTERVPLVIALLAEHPACQRCDRARSVDIHEPKLRSRGGDPYAKAQCVALCRACHDWIHAHPDLATAECWMKNSWEAA